MELLSPEEFSKYIRKKRNKNEINQEVLAKKTGLSNSQISRLEKNSVNYSYKVAFKLWDALEHYESDEHSAGDLMHDEIAWANADEKVKEVAEKMVKHNYSQLPVKDKNNKNIGRITEDMFIDIMDYDKKVREIMGNQFSEVNPEIPISHLEILLKEDEAVLVVDKSSYKGILTSADTI